MGGRVSAQTLLGMLICSSPQDKLYSHGIDNNTNNINYNGTERKRTEAVAD